MGAKNIKNLEKCTATDIIDYFEDIIGNDLEEIIYDLYDARVENTDKTYIDGVVRNLNITDINQITELRRNLIYGLLEQAPQNNDISIKLKILYEIYVRYHEKLLKPENAKKMHRLKSIILGDKGAVILAHHDKGQLKYDIVTREEQKSVDDIENEQTRELMNVAFDSITSAEDIDQTVKYPMLASNVLRKCLIEFMYDLGATDADIESMSEEPIFYEDTKILNTEELSKIIESEKVLNLFFMYVKDYLRKNLQLIDTDTLLKNSVARLILGIRINSGEKFEEIELRDEIDQDDFQGAMRNSIRCLHNFYNELLKKPSNASMAYQILGKDGKEIIRISMEYIKQFLERCTQYKYFSDQEIEQIHNDIRKGILPEDNQVRKIANINIEDLANASKSYEEALEDDETKTKLLACSAEIIKYLKETGTIENDEQLLELYLNGTLNIDIIDSIEMFEIEEESHIEKFKSVYDGTQLDDEEGINKKKLARYSELYKRLASKDKLNIDNLIENLVEEYGEDRGNKILIELYNLGMLNLEDCINWGGTDVLKKLFEMEERNIQPNQINKLYHNNKLSINDIANLILRIPNMEERYITIASIFPEMSESEERQELLYKTIKVEKTLNKHSQTVSNDPVPPTPPSEYNKHITDSTYRFNLIRLLDKDFFMEMTADGHAIIKLPKFKKVMIEKMLDTKKEEGYGAATYILDEDYYKTNMDKIKVDGKINRRELKLALKEEKAIRVLHIVDLWGEQIKEYFTKLSESKYTESEIQMIDTAIENIKNSVKIIGVGKHD